MISLLRLTAGLLFVGILTAGCFALQPKYFAGMGLDIGELPDILRRFHDEEIRLKALEKKDKQLFKIMAFKDATIHELIEGGLTLAEAVERFRQEIGGDLPRLLTQVRLIHPDVVEEDLLHQHVIDWTVSVLDHHPDRCFRMVARLQLELRAAS